MAAHAADVDQADAERARAVAGAALAGRGRRDAEPVEQRQERAVGSRVEELAAALDRDASHRRRGDAAAEAVARLQQHHVGARRVQLHAAAAMPETPPPTTIASYTGDTSGRAVR